MGPVLAILLTLQTTPVEPLVEKGVRHLKSRFADLSKDPEFSLWTLVTTGSTWSDPVVQGLLEQVLSKPPQNTRSAALQAMTLGALHPVEYRLRIAHCAQFLADNQCDDGQWDAGRPVDPPPLSFPPERKIPDVGPLPPRPTDQILIRRRAAGPGKGSSVPSRWAAWGLLACTEARFVLLPETWEKAEAAWRTGDHDPADVVSSLSIHLYLQKKNWKKDADVLRAVERLAQRGAPTDPKSLLLLKRAMVHFGSHELGGREWWQDGVRTLAASQSPDGSWGTVEETCGATIFLHTPRRPWMTAPDRK
jgi:hypothetical protein